jgi:hypothetical protein
MNVRLVQLDGSLPNLALMKLAHWHRSKGDYVHRAQSIHPTMFEPQWDKVYGSAIFKFSQVAVKQFKQEWPEGLLGGTGTDSLTTVEQLIGTEYEHYDYADYPDVEYSIGFTQRGCRLSCKFCVVPKKEGKPRSVNTIADIWRGEGHPKHLHILDNDFYGNPDWKLRLAEIRDGNFKVCMSQGINVRLINQEAAEALASIQYRDKKFSRPTLYTAWDNIGDERIFFKGVELLNNAGIPSKHLRAYMLIGYDPKETWERIWYRFNKMVEAGIEPYPMVFDRSRIDLICFQRWVISGIYRFVKWPDYKRQTKSAESVEAYPQ